MSSSRASARSRLAFGTLLALLFAGSFGGAYAFRQRQLDTTASPTDLQPPVETTAAADTTTPLVVDTSIADTTLAPVETTAVPETTSAPVTTISPQSLVLSTDGALFGSGSSRGLWDDAVGCDSIATRSGAASACDRLSLGGVNVAWVIDAQGGATVLQNDPGSDEPGTWNVELETSSTPSRPPLVTDVTGDGQPELVFGFRNGSTLAVDVVEIRDGNAGVVLHLDLPSGRVTAGDGQLDVWQQAGGGDFEHWTVRRDGGRWTKDGFERTGSPPAGNF
jgi:hypothetical protein